MWSIKSVQWTLVYLPAKPPIVYSIISKDMISFARWKILPDRNRPPIATIDIAWQFSTCCAIFFTWSSGVVNTSRCWNVLINNLTIVPHTRLLESYISTLYLKPRTQATCTCTSMYILTEELGRKLSTWLFCMTSFMYMYMCMATRFVIILVEL